MKQILAGLIVLTIAVPAFGQPHAPVAQVGALGPTEAGQDVFAAIREIIQRLERDPSTDWSKVNIGALRDHLVDMNNVMLRSDVRTIAITGGSRFEVTGRDPEVVSSIRRMALAHARSGEGAGPGARMEAREAPGGAVVTVTAANAADKARIRGLGFYGLISQGSHHGPHHLMMASGAMGHAH